MWSVARGNVWHVCCHSDSARRSLAATSDLFTAIFPVYATIGVFSEYMATCLCLRGTSNPYSTIHTKIKASISKSEIDSLPFGSFCFISDYFTSRLHYCLQTRGSGSSVPPIHTSPQPSPDTSMSAIYYRSPYISYMYFFGSLSASCSIRLIPSKDCLTAVNFARFTHDGSCPRTKFTGFKIPFAAFMPMVAWRHLPITEQIFLKYTLPLRFIAFRACNMFHVCLVLVQWTSITHQKLTLVLHFLFPTGLCPFPILLLILGLGCNILLLTVVVRLCESHVGVRVIGVAGVTPMLVGRC